MGAPRFDRQRTLKTLKEFNWDRGLSAEKLNITRSCLWERILKLHQEGFDLEIDFGKKDTSMEYTGFPSNEERLENKNNPRGYGCYGNNGCQ